MEVEATVSGVIGLKDATSYGVEIAGYDGKYPLILCLLRLLLIVIIFIC